MSRSNWLTIIAVGAVAVASFALGSSGAFRQPPANQISAPPAQAAPDKQDAAQDRAAFEIQQNANPAGYPNACKSPSSYNEADLCQQWRAANGANQAANFAERQFWATIVETGLLVVTLILSGWAALAASSAAKTARRELEELERPNLLLHIRDSGVVDSDGVVDFPNPTTFVFHNYGRSPGFMVTVKARLHYRKIEDGIPPPVDWMKKSARIFSYGSIIKQDGDSEVFDAKAREFVSEDDVKRIGKYGHWYLHGFAGYHDSMNGLYTLGFFLMWEEGEWRIASADSLEDNRKYNYNKRYRPPKLGARLASGLAKWMRTRAEKIYPTPTDY